MHSEEESLNPWQRNPQCIHGRGDEAYICFYHNLRSDSFDQPSSDYEDSKGIWDLSLRH